MNAAEHRGHQGYLLSWRKGLKFCDDEPKGAENLKQLRFIDDSW
jgi:hypothetical protein